MKKLMKNILVVGALLCLSVISYGQTKSAFIEAAEKAYAEKNYYAALSYFNEVLEFDDRDVNALVKSAEAARQFNSYEVAAEKYSFLLDSLQYDQDSTMVVRLADMYQRLGKYDLATDYYDRYISEFGVDGDSLTQYATSTKESVVWAASRSKEIDSSYVLTKMGEEVNGNGSDFAPQVVEDDLYFTSMAFTRKDPDTREEISISKIMKRVEDQTATPLESDINDREKLVANIAFSLDRSRAYYSVCDYVDANTISCDIYVSMVDPEGNLFNERKLAAPVNEEGSTSTQPTLRYDKELQSEVLYFVSDREGGKGKLDIYSVVVSKEGGYEDLTNLEAINTEGDDLSPFYHSPTATMYFSTDGRMGLGGYDVYSSLLSDGIWLDPQPLPAPVNSSYHDAFYVVSDDEEMAYMASNREGASYIDNELKSCCYDIFQVEHTPAELELNALTFDKSSLTELDGATVTVVDKISGEQIGTLTPLEDHEHIFKIFSNREYLVIGSKENYKSDTLELSTRGLAIGDTLVEKLYLEPDGISLEVLTFDDQTKDALNGVTVTIEDLSDPTNTKQVKLNELGNNFDFLIEPGKTYRITASKNRFNTVTQIIDTRGLSGKLTQKIYLPRFDLAAYLPIALYFDNDHPDPDSKSTYTDKVYYDLLQDYMRRKPTFKEEYTKGLDQSSKMDSDRNMENFFEGNVKGGYDQFRIFMDGLIKELESGARINLTVRGYASPRFDIRYNLVLAQRRIQSAKNDMMTYRDGVLSKYLKQKQLIITEISLGEELAPSDVSDNLYDEKGSIYSVKASKQRRIEILSIKSN